MWGLPVLQPSDRKMRMPERRRPVSITGHAALAFSALLGALACSSDDTSLARLAAGCTLNSDCVQPLVCSFGRCHAACRSSVDCPPTQSCIGSPRGGVCQLPSEATCSATQPCAESLVCQSDLRCHSRCSASSECTTGQRCIAGSCHDRSERDDAGPGDGGPRDARGLPGRDAENEASVGATTTDATLLEADGGSSGSCKAPYASDLALATKTQLPRTFLWASYRECQAPVNNGSTTTVAGSECQASPCGSCRVVWGAVTVAADGLSVDVPFTGMCEVPGWTGYNYCDQRWADSYKQSCTLGLSASGTLHLTVDAATYLPGRKTVSWQILAGTATGTWSSSAATTCQYFAPGASTTMTLNHGLETAIGTLGTLTYQCP